MASRTHDQLVQAARSGVRNISEGSGAAATSRKMELKLTNVARASLNDELARDYQSFLLQRGLRVQARAGTAGEPQCPVCGKPMRRRSAGKTAREFWGCTGFPNCRGSREIET